MALFLTGTVVGGMAVGAIFVGNLSTARLAPAGIRGRVVSTYFVFSYVGLIPVIGVGIVSWTPRPQARLMTACRKSLVRWWPGSEKIFSGEESSIT